MLTPRSPKNPAPRTAAVLAVATLASSCASIQVSSQVLSDLDVNGVGAYDWEYATHVSAPNSELDGRIRSALETELDRLGFRHVAREEARLALSYAVDVETRMRPNDPYFEMGLGEQYEIGTLTVELADAGTGRALWRGVGESELRVSARVFGLNALRLVPTTQDRDWRVEDKVDAVLERLDRDLARNGADAGAIQEPDMASAPRPGTKKPETEKTVAPRVAG